MLDHEQHPPATPLHVGVGSTYREKATGRTWILIGRRSGRRIALLYSPGGNEQQLRDLMSVAELEANYEHLRCNHDDYCCTLHSTHASPHRGCVLR